MCYNEIGSYLDSVKHKGPGTTPKKYKDSPMKSTVDMMKNIIFCITICCIFVSTNLAAEWTLIDSTSFIRLVPRTRVAMFQFNLEQIIYT